MNRLVAGAVGVGLIAGACGGEGDPLSRFQEDRSGEIAELEAQLAPAQEQLSAMQADWNARYESLSDDCQEAADDYFPPNPNRSTWMSDNEVVQLNAQWCGPENQFAIPQLRDLWIPMAETQDKVNQLELEIAQNVSAELFDEAAIISIKEFDFEDPQLISTITDLGSLTFTVCDAELDALSVSLLDGSDTDRTVVVCFPEDGEPYGIDAVG